MVEHHASKQELPVEQLGDYQGRMAEFGPYTMNFERIPAGMGGPEMFKGLPDDACQCEHMGYLFKGKFKVSYTDGHDEIVTAGQGYFMKPGHVFEALEECETIEFSPTDDLQQTLAQIEKNMAAGPEGF